MSPQKKTTALVLSLCRRYGAYMVDGQLRHEFDSYRTSTVVLRHGMSSIPIAGVLDRWNTSSIPISHYTMMEHHEPFKHWCWTTRVQVWLLSVKWFTFPNNRQIASCFCFLIHLKYSKLSTGIYLLYKCELQQLRDNLFNLLKKRKLSKTSTSTKKWKYLFLIFHYAHKQKWH